MLKLWEKKNFIPKVIRYRCSFTMRGLHPDKELKSKIHLMLYCGVSVVYPNGVTVRELWPTAAGQHHERMP